MDRAPFRPPYPPPPYQASTEQRGRASLERSKMEQTGEQNRVKYKDLSTIIHCPHGEDPKCPCIKNSKYIK
jgi:hypothetical protein